MKTLRQLTNVEKAGILHSWFPEEIAPIVDAIQGMSESIIKNEQQERETWTLGLLNFDFWLQLARNADTIIIKYQKKLATNKRLFADQLFDGYQAIFTVHCITGYAKTKRLENRELFLVIELLFN
ncbi:hypothetical protein AMR72_15175 [Flavobacterium psychrophilum]|nr:hypothetical protein AMR72_15175 [Flavobacterium psychrophilum]AOE53740.1 hypothetical protein ALW18_15165 [Flavobacterium psychrophilum]